MFYPDSGYPGKIGRVADICSSPPGSSHQTSNKAQRQPGERDISIHVEPKINNDPAPWIQPHLSLMLHSCRTSGLYLACTYMYQSSRDGPP